MACPCFYPTDRLPLAAGKRTPLMPLGDPWSGVCHAASSDAPPDSRTIQQLCNFGYARGKCPRLPAQSADAVRFGVSQDRDGLLSIYWVMEKDHLPFAHGPLEYARDAGFREAPADPCIARQAHAYVTSYLRRKAQRGAEVRAAREDRNSADQIAAPGAPSCASSLEAQRGAGFAPPLTRGTPQIDSGARCPVLREFLRS